LGEPGLREAAEAALKSPADWTQELALGEGGYRRVFRARSHLVKSRKGEDLGAVLVLHDVTLEKEIEQMKDDFVHSITHDLRNPVGSIQGFTGFLLDESAGPLTDQQRKFLEIISRSSDRLLGLVNDI
ncbi:MAG: histidine kinase dimerization/phospho-acceptor domain-containing protein, partial [bacterium]